MERCVNLPRRSERLASSWTKFSAHTSVIRSRFFAVCWAADFSAAILENACNRIIIIRAVQEKNKCHHAFRNYLKLNRKMASSKTVIDPNDYVPKRFGLKFGATPTIILEYLVPSSGKLFHHKMRLRNLKADSDIEETVGAVMKKHSVYLQSKRITKAQLTELVRKLLSKFKAKQPQLAEFDYNKVDLNKLNNAELDAHKKKMDEAYYKNYRDPKAEDFIYDIEQEFPNGEQVDNSWDD
eukprot:TRINITY_DN4106_c0_g3_i1.p1 TRINITY_DN4106_c0_g3~~TRINITY_DN4106_c0_g3_i1.p1  ORF type:complete len:239 (-),score=67.18 TRINITY_DN4106_c0_g3_i1:82-798(-)